MGGGNIPRMQLELPIPIEATIKWSPRSEQADLVAITWVMIRTPVLAAVMLLLVASCIFAAEVAFWRFNDDNSALRTANYCLKRVF